ncbi:MAG: alternative ribosome rescue aminoacyl-tRNA hydrolase ArfB [Isosphaeraceae bacterium]
MRVGDSREADVTLRIDDRLAIPLDEFTWEYSRSSGPGGQNVNKVNSKVQLRWKPAESPSLPEPVRQRLLAQIGNKLTGDGELLIASQASRDQGRNVDACLEKLRQLVAAAAHPPRPRRPTRPTRASQERRVESKTRRSETKRNRRAPGLD